MCNIYRDYHSLCHYLVLLALFCPGCLFGGKEDKREVVYPIATATVPQERRKEPEPKVEKRTSSSRKARAEMDSRLKALSEETKEAQRDLLTRVTALETDTQQLSDKLSLIEFLQQESSDKMAKMQEKLEFELETLRGQIEDYNALLVDILNKISGTPESAVAPESSPLENLK